MKKRLQTKFSTRQYMLSKDFELYYYNDSSLKKVSLHTHDYYEFYFFLEGNVSIQVEQQVYPVSFGDMIVIPPGISHKPVIRDEQVPYRRFVFWISAEFYEHLLLLSGDYGYLTEYVQNNNCYIFHNDRIAFNTIQSKILRLLSEMQSDRFGHSAQTSLYVSDLLLHINRLIYERNHPVHYSEPDSLRNRLHQIFLRCYAHRTKNLRRNRISGRIYRHHQHTPHVCSGTHTRNRSR